MADGFLRQSRPHGELVPVGCVRVLIESLANPGEPWPVPRPRICLLLLPTYLIASVYRSVFRQTYRFLSCSPLSDASMTFLLAPCSSWLTVMQIEVREPLAP